MSRKEINDWIDFLQLIFLYFCLLEVTQLPHLIDELMLIIWYTSSQRVFMIEKGAIWKFPKIWAICGQILLLLVNLLQDQALKFPFGQKRIPTIWKLMSMRKFCMTIFSHGVILRGIQIVQENIDKQIKCPEKK